MGKIDTFTGSKYIRGGIILPLIVAGALVFVFLRVDLKATFESEQFKKNKAYVKNLITTTIGENFFETRINSDTNKTAHFDFSSFLPQINTMEIKNPNFQNFEEIKINNEEGSLDSEGSGYTKLR